MTNTLCVNENCINQFSNRKYESKNIWSNSRPNAIICIINNYKNRPGSQEDVDSLFKLSGDLHFAVFENKVHADLNEDKIVELMKRFANYKVNETKVPRILIIMCHGNEDRLIDASGASYDLDEVILPHFSSTERPALDDVLKLIVVQSCRGDLFPVYYDANNPIPKSYFYKNILVGSSAKKGHRSIRIPGVGCPYIQYFCSIMRECWKNKPKANVFRVFKDIHEKMSDYKVNGRHYKLVPEMRLIGDLDDTFINRGLYLNCISVAEKEIPHNIHQEIPLCHYPILEHEE